MTKASNRPSSPAKELEITQYTLVYQYLVTRTGCPHTAEDLTQATFLRVLRNSPRPGSVQNYAAWLLRVARNLLINHLQSRILFHATGDSLSSRDPGPEEIAEDREETQALQHLLLRLSPLQASLVRAHYLGGRSCKDLAHERGITYEALKSSLHRARKQLRKLAMEGNK